MMRPNPALPPATVQALPQVALLQEWLGGAEDWEWAGQSGGRGAED